METSGQRNGSPQRLIVGLGNPGDRYALTRHNVGFAVVDRLCSLAAAHWRALDYTRALAACRQGHEGDWMALKPLTYMNRSGQAVRAVVDRESFSLEDILVVCDDIQLPLGQLRLRRQGRAGGHNGLASIIEALGSVEFARLRVGVGAPPPGVPAEDFVLGEFSSEGREKIPEIVDSAVEACQAWLAEPIDRVMSRVNTRG